MRIGTRSLLFGVHQFAIHPWFVGLAWWKLYGFPWDPRLWIAFVIHDWGYWGKPNMDGPEGELHPLWAGRVMYRLFDGKVQGYEYFEWRHGGKGVPWRVDPKEFSDMRLAGWQIATVHATFTLLERPVRSCLWCDLCRYHSRYLAKQACAPYSPLCVADKLAIALQPWWFYGIASRLSGELREYMEGKRARTPAQDRTPREWYRDVQRYSRAWAYEHADGRQDTWTGTKRDLARSEMSQ